MKTRYRLVVLVAALAAAVIYFNGTQVSQEQAAGRAPPSVHAAPPDPVTPTVRSSVGWRSATAETSRGRPGPGMREFCGWGNFAASELELLPVEARAVAQQHVRALVRSMAGRDPHRRAMALAIEIALDRHPASIASGLSEEQARRHVHEVEVANSSRYAQLVRLATESSDPAVYREALTACQSNPSSVSNACAQLSAAQLARLDPQDGRSWVMAAQDAWNRGDRAARDEAVYQLGRASRFTPAMTAGRLASDPLLTSIPARERNAVLALLLELDWLAPVPIYGPLMDYCPKQLGDDHYRRERCEAMAAVLRQHDPLLIGRLIGIEIAKRSERSAETIAALEDTKLALFGAAAEIFPEASELTSCESMPRLEVLLSAVTVGDAKAIDQHIRSTNRSMTELAAQERARRAAQARDEKQATEPARR